MRTIKIILIETEGDGVEATIEINPPIAWEERMTTKVEKVATWLAKIVFWCYGVKLIHVNQARG